MARADAGRRAPRPCPASARPDAPRPAPPTSSIPRARARRCEGGKGVTVQNTTTDSDPRGASPQGWGEGSAQDPLTLATRLPVTPALMSSALNYPQANSTTPLSPGRYAAAPRVTFRH